MKRLGLRVRRNGGEPLVLDVLLPEEQLATVAARIRRAGGYVGSASDESSETGLVDLFLLPGAEVEFELPGESDDPPNCEPPPHPSGREA